MNAKNMAWLRQPNVRWMLFAGGVVVVALIWFAVPRRNDTPVQGNPTPADTAMQEMTGMAGMSGGDTGSVRLTTAQIRRFGVTFDTAKLRTLTSEVRAAGTVTFDETRIAQVTPKFSGYVDRLFVNATGQPVARGQPVAAIFSPELVAAQQELLLAARLDRSMGQSSVPGVPAGSSNLLAAARNRLRLWDISDAQVNAILRNGNVQRTLTLFSPVPGIVVEKNVVQGQSVTAGMPLMTIADLSTVWVEVELREADARGARVGSSAVVELSASPGQLIAGHVSYVYPTLQQEARTLKARIVLPNPGGRIKPGMYATVRLSTPGASALTVPSAAVLRAGDRNVVFVDMGNGEVMPHDVKLGRTAGELTEILSGLKPGQRVVTSAQFLLDSESNLGEVMKAMISQTSSGDKAGPGMPGMKPPSTRK